MTLDDLGSEALSWYDLAVLVKHLQVDQSTALSTELHGTRWSTESQLLAYVVDALHVGNWQRAGRKSAPRPKPFPRPWEKSKARTLGSKPIPLSQFNDWWDSHKPKRRRRPKP